MKQGTLKSLEYFVGRVCTVFVSDMPKHFSHQQFNDYFVGLVESANEDGVVTIHPVTHCKNFFPYSHIVGIAEEQVLNPSKPEEAQLIQEIKQKGVAPSMEIKPPSPFVDINNMANLAKQAKELDRNGTK